MDQPKTHRGQATKEAIVRAAAALMYERGVRATTLDEVLDAADAGKSQLYHYFADKGDLTAAVLEHQLAQVLRQQGDHRLDTWAGLRSWFEALLEGQVERNYRGCPVGALAAEMTAEGMADAVARAFAHWQRTLEAAFARMEVSGRLVPGTRAERLAEATLRQIQGGYLLSSAARDLGPMRRALDAAYAYLRSFRV